MKTRIIVLTGLLIHGLLTHGLAQTSTLPARLLNSPPAGAETKKNAPTATAERRGESTVSTDRRTPLQAVRDTVAIQPRFPVMSHQDTLMALSSMSPMAPALALGEENIIGSYYVELSFNKTVSIIFNSPVRSVDLGSRDIIADKASDVENILKVKSTKLGFNETNFSVITADGKFYSFIANYNEYTPLLAINLAARTPAIQKGKVALGSRAQPINGVDKEDGVIQFSGVRATQSDIVYNCDKVMRKRRNVRHVGMEANQMEATVRGVYVEENVVYYKLAMTNKSNINYDIDYVRFFVKDKGSGKSVSRQEIEVHPFYVYNDEINVVRGKKSIERVYAFPKFTIPDNKQVVIETGEQNGGRVLSFVLNNSDIMGADLF